MPRTKQAGRGRKRATRKGSGGTPTNEENAEDSRLDGSQSSVVSDTNTSVDQAEESMTTDQDEDATLDSQDANANADKGSEKAQSKDEEKTAGVEGGDGQDADNKENQQKGKRGETKEMTEEERLKAIEERQRKEEEERGPSFKPHIIPNISCKGLIEKWEWHLRIFPIDQADIRTCVLESVSKIAQETWFHVDKQNFGMGSFNLCLRSMNDAYAAMIKILQAPMTYRYVTFEIIRRGKNQKDIDKIKESKTQAGSQNGDGEDATEEKGDKVGKEDVKEEKDEEVEKAIEKLPYTEVEETATVLLDFMHAASFDKSKGKENKRSLYVKYLPESTTKELLKVLFPVANNLDILMTKEGRRYGDLNLNHIDNIRSTCTAYVTVHIGEMRNISLDWKEENVDDGVQLPEPTAELPWEIIPRNVEIPYEALPELEQDERIQYRKRKREMEIDWRKNRPRERKSRWDRSMVPPPPMGPDVLNMQIAMNERIQSQLALLQNVASPGPIPSLLDTPRPPPPLMGGRNLRDRKRDRSISESSRHSDDTRAPRDRGMRPGFDRRDRSGPRDRRDSFENRSDHGRGGRYDNQARGRGGFGGRGSSPGDGGRFGGRAGGSRFDNDSRGRGRFDNQRGGGSRFDSGGRGRSFDSRGGGRFDSPRGGSSRFDSRPQGSSIGRSEPQGRNSTSRFDSQGRGRGTDTSRGGGADSRGRGATSRGGSSFGRGGGRSNQQSFGNQQSSKFGFPNTFGNQQSSYSNQGSYNYSQGNQSGYGNQNTYNIQSTATAAQPASYGAQQSQSTYGAQQTQSYGAQQSSGSNYGSQQTGYSGYGSYGNQATSQSSYPAAADNTSSYWNQSYQPTAATYGSQSSQATDYSQTYGQQQATAYGAPQAGSAPPYNADTSYSGQGYYAGNTTSQTTYPGYGGQQTYDQNAYAASAYNYQYPSGTS